MYIIMEKTSTLRHVSVLVRDSRNSHYIHRLTTPLVVHEGALTRTQMTWGLKHDMEIPERHSISDYVSVVKTDKETANRIKNHVFIHDGQLWNLWIPFTRKPRKSYKRMIVL